VVAQFFADITDSHFADDVDMNGPADSGSDDGSSWSGDGGSISSSLVVNGPGPYNGAGSDTPATFLDTSIPATVAGLFEALAPEVAWAHNLSFSNPNPTTIGPSNYGLTDFLHHWARQSRVLQSMSRGSCPWPSRVNALQASQDESIEYDDLEGDLCDFQGVDWEDIGVTRMDARERRLLTYNNYVNIPGSDRWTVSTICLPRLLRFENPSTHFCCSQIFRMLPFHAGKASSGSDAWTSSPTYTCRISNYVMCSRARRVRASSTPPLGPFSSSTPCPAMAEPS
jgi:hypothetical protein